MGIQGYPKIGVIEFGCCGGNRLASAEKDIVKVEKLFPIKIDALCSMKTVMGFGRYNHQSRAQVERR